MQFPRYELVLPSEREPTRPRPRPTRRPPRVRPRLRRMVRRRPPSGRLDIHQYLELEFTVDERR